MLNCFARSTVPMTVPSDAYRFFIRLRITSATAIFPMRGSPAASPMIVRTAQWSSSTSRTLVTSTTTTSATLTHCLVPSKVIALSTVDGCATIVADKKPIRLAWMAVFHRDHRNNAVSERIMDVLIVAVLSRLRRDRVLLRRSLKSQCAIEHLDDLFALWVHQNPRPSVWPHLQ